MTLHLDGRDLPVRAGELAYLAAGRPGELRSTRDAAPASRPSTERAQPRTLIPVGGPRHLGGDDRPRSPSRLGRASGHETLWRACCRPGEPVRRSNRVASRRP